MSLSGSDSEQFCIYSETLWKFPQRKYGKVTVAQTVAVGV